LPQHVSLSLPSPTIKGQLALDLARAAVPGDNHGDGNGGPHVSLPLSGVTVLDLTRVLAGPYATMVLGDLGADVIKVERLPGGDDARAMGPFRDGQSFCFAQVNRNKRGVAIDLRHPEGRQALLALAARSDVVVENFRPGTAERLGCGYDAVRAVRPDVIYCSISGFGQTGPYAQRPAYDIIAQGISGFLSMTGYPGGPPAKSGIALNDIAGGVTAVQAILAAYIARLRGEGGQYIDTSLVEAGVAWTVWEAAAYFGTGEVAAPAGTRHRRNAPYQAFRTSDGYVTVGGNTERMWHALCTEVLGRPDWTSRPEYATAAGRLAHGDELERDIESVLVTDTTEHWVGAMLAAGVPAGPVNTYDQMIADPHLTARGVTTTVQHPVLGPVRMLSSPLRLSKTPPRIQRAAPLLGQHTAQVLGSLGYPDEEVSALQAAGAVYDPALPSPTGGTDD
jgi:crotonobetainyl-CoA:carnitine CoA-transferase CaiB-like acyl-CoA transferase